MTKYAKAIKNQLTEELSKNGSSLQEFEAALQNINTGEGVLKVAAEAGGMLGGIADLALKSSLTGGALAGLGFDEMDKSVHGVNKALEREREKVNLVRRLTLNLRREHGIH